MGGGPVIGGLSLQRSSSAPDLETHGGGWRGMGRAGGEMNTGDVGGLCQDSYPGCATRCFRRRQAYADLDAYAGEAAESAACAFESNCEILVDEQANKRCKNLSAACGYRPVSPP